MQTKMKKFLATLLAAVSVTTAAGSLAGCGGTHTFKDLEIPEGGYDGSKQTVEFYHTMGQNLTEVLDNYIEKFNVLYPNITIDHKQVGDYDDVRDQISKELTAGNQPNVAYCYPDHVALYNIAGSVQTLDDLIASDITVTRADDSTETLGLTQTQIDDFIPGYYNEGKAFGDNKMYTLPFSKSTEVLYYDKTFFDANNLTPPKTWDELEKLCADILAIDKNCIPLGYDSEANWFITMCEQYESPYTSADSNNHFLFDNETNRAFVQKFAEWYQKGYVTTKELNGGFTSSLFKEQTGKTRSYMSIGSSAGATKQCPDPDNKGKYPFEVGITTIPQVKADKPKVISQGPSLCIFKKDNPQEVLATWLFVKYFTTSIEFQSDFSIASGYVPVLQSVVEDPYYATFLNKPNTLEGQQRNKFIAALSAKVCMDQATAYYVSPAFKGSSVARDEVGALMQKCFTEAKGKNLSGQSLADMIKKEFKNAVEECEYQV